MSAKLGGVAYERDPGNFLAAADRPYPVREHDYADETAASRAASDGFTRSNSTVTASRSVSLKKTLRFSPGAATTGPSASGRSPRMPPLCRQ
jgi:hypothetical protein